MKTNTGGAAFPYAAVHGCNGEYGMTLRDYFATYANEEDIKYWQPTGELVERVAVTSSGKVIYQESGKYTREQARYLYADAMLKARQA